MCKRHNYPPLLFPDLWQKTKTIPCVECGKPILHFYDYANEGDPPPQWQCNQHESDPRLPSHWPLYYQSLAFPLLHRISEILPAERNGSFSVKKIVGDNWATKYTQNFLEKEYQSENRTIGAKYPRTLKVQRLLDADLKNVEPVEVDVYFQNYGYVSEGNHRLFVTRMRGLNSILNTVQREHDYLRFLGCINRVCVWNGRAKISIESQRNFVTTSLESAAELERLHTLWWTRFYGGYPQTFLARLNLFFSEHPWEKTWMPSWMSFRERCVRALYFVGVFNTLPLRAVLPNWQVD